MAYQRGTNANIIVGAAALFVHNGTDLDADLAAAPYTPGVKYTTTLGEHEDKFTNVGYTSNGLELDFQPDFGEVKVDQILDVARLYKQGMKVNMKTTFAEATLENLLVALASNEGLDTGSGWKGVELTAGELGDYPVERGLVAVGPSTYGAGADAVERIYKAYRALSIENVTVSAKREEATMFAVSFRLLPTDDGSYGKIVDRTIGSALNVADTTLSAIRWTSTTNAEILQGNLIGTGFDNVTVVDESTPSGTSTTAGRVFGVTVDGDAAVSGNTYAHDKAVVITKIVAVA